MFIISLQLLILSMQVIKEKENKRKFINPYNKPKLKILIKYILLLPLLMLMVFMLELELVLVLIFVPVLVLLSLLLVMMLVVAAATTGGGGCGAAASVWVSFNKLNGFLEVQYARIFWIYLSKNDDSMYFKYC